MRFAALFAAAAATLALAFPASALTVESSVSPTFMTKLKREHLGVREASVLTTLVSKTINRVFTAHGVTVERVVVTIEDADPSHPTYSQAAYRMGLDRMRSMSLGGAKVSGIAYDASGKEIGRFQDKWYASDLAHRLASTTWSDAQYSFSRFAIRFADKLT